MTALPAQTAPKDLPTEQTRVFRNTAWRADIRPLLSVVIPTYRDDATRLISELDKAATEASIEIILYEDGPQPEGLATAHQAAAEAARRPVSIVSADVNLGRARARNALFDAARGEWALCLDADMTLPSRGFLQRYISAIDEATKPSVIVGGYTLDGAPNDPDLALHRWQAARSECLNAEARSKAPGRHVFSCNIAAHRSVFSRVHFDEGFTGWGWEDVDWGMRASELAPIIHIDNPAIHMGLDPADALMGKYARSADNFAYLMSKRSIALAKSPLARNARRFRELPFRPALRAIFAAIAEDRANIWPLALRGRALKVWRALIYAEKLQ